MYTFEKIRKRMNHCRMYIDIPCYGYGWRAVQFQLHICFLLLLAVIAHSKAPVIARPGCPDTCGGVRIPFPFGMGAGCFFDHWFEIDCRPPSPASNSSLPTPFLSSFNLEVIQIAEDFSIISDYSQSLKVMIPPRSSCAAADAKAIDLTGSPYDFKNDNEVVYNVFMMEGCPGSALLVDRGQATAAGCATVCEGSTGLPATSGCYGVDCCQTPLDLSADLSLHQIEFNHGASNGSRSSCLAATMISSDSVDQFAGRLSGSDPASAVPVFLAWNWISNTPPDSNSHASCPRYLSDGFIHCNCDSDHNYYGNPYVSNGCQVPKPCKRCKSSCNPQRKADGNYIPDKYYSCDAIPIGAIIGFSISFGLVFMAIGIYGLYRFIKRRREMKRRAKFFKRNGGLLLQQQLSSSDESIMEKTKIFTVDELDKATDHFNENRILGQGGQGTVYKGMLINGRIVAIKKSKSPDESQLEQFTNEVIVLSQINHRNVVKLLGCCLETEVPLLVYEFIPNGTLHQYIHEPDEEFLISWEMRLKIAADSADAVAYLHSSASIPIYHRDIKSLNILLDEKHRARVADFGSSKTIAIDQTHLTTKKVQGTMGYLDPEYYQSNQFTEKSDVYSFGVVLLEILTGRKPIYRDASTMEQKNLVTEFLFLTEQSGLSSILDPEIVKQAKEEELNAMVQLAKCCISWSGKLRPTMKDVAMALEMIMKSPDQASSCYQQAAPADTI